MALISDLGLSSGADRAGPRLRHRSIADRPGNETVNLAFGEGRTLVDVVNIIALAVGKQAKVTYEPSRSGEVTRYVADVGKARDLLGYEPQTPRSGGLVRTVHWWRETGKL